MTDSEFLNWLADRLVHVYGESENVDFVLKVRRLAQAAAHPVAQEAKDLYYELRGVIADVEQGNGFDAVCLETVKRVAAALAAPQPSQGAEPFAYYVYIPAEQRGEFVHDLDEAVDDLTNCECEITELYAAPPQPVSAEAGKGVDRTGRIHELKTDPAVFDAVWKGQKTFEIRYNDRDFKVGDSLYLCETKYSGKQMKDGLPLEYTDRTLMKVVSHVLSGYGLADGWVCLSFAPSESVAGSGEVSERMRAWIEEAVEYVNVPTMSPSLEREGRALLALAKTK